MSTTFTPSLTAGAPGNLLAAATPVAASASTSFNVDVSAGFEMHVQVLDTAVAAVAGTNGLQVQVFPRVGTGPATDTVASMNFSVATVLATPQAQTVKLQTGRYTVKVTNLDATNGITAGVTGDAYSITGG